MRRLIVGIFAGIGLFFVVVIAGAVTLAVWASHRTPPIADNTIVTLDLTQPFPDTPQSNSIPQRLLGPDRQSLLDVLDGLERAGNDPHVKGLVAHIGDGEFGFAEIQELRTAIAQFRAKGKHAVAYADSFGELSSGIRSYYLATAFDEIWLQPLGMVGLVGLRSEVPFFRGTLDMLGVVPRFDHREEFKSAMNSLTETKMTPAQREETESLLTSIYGQVIRGVAADRKLDEAALRTLVDRGPFLANEALSAHLVDHIGYRDEASAALTKTVGGNTHPLALAAFLDRSGHPHRSGPTIALIYANGLIMSGSSSSNPLDGSESLGADTLIAAFRKAEEDPTVKAILFRINSPGGSAVASESIWRETIRAHDAGKPVIVSMGDVAGSGGYYIAAGADKIVADPATLTGSIGVVAGKLVIGDLLKKFGASWDSVQVGANADIGSGVEDFSAPGLQRFEAFLDDTYAGFKQRVADGRKLDAGAVEQVAKGRVWTGEDAKANGLVDAIGGYGTALALAKQAAKIDGSQDVTIKIFPPPVDPFSAALARVSGHDDDEGVGTDGLMRNAAMLRPVLRELDLLARPGAGVLVMPPVNPK